MRIAAIIQARMGSTRLPGKVLKPLMDGTVLSHVIHRLQASELINEIVIATTTSQIDDAIQEETSRVGVRCYRGSEHDVLSRYYEAASEIDANIIVRVTSDCPMIDPFLVDEVIRLLIDQRADYASNVLERTLPRGLDAEVFTMKALTIAYEKAEHPEQREHVTPYLHQHPEIFKIVGHKHEVDYSQYRWTLDTPEDWQLISEIYELLYEPMKLFLWLDIMELMEQHPELAQINAHIEQKKLTT